MFEPFVGGEVFPCPLLVGDESVADFDFPVTSLSLVAFGFQRTALAVLGAVGGLLDDISALGPVVPRAHAPHVLAHRADEVVALGVVVEVLHASGILLEGALLLHVEVVVLDVGLDAVLLHEAVVLLAAVARVGHTFIGEAAVVALERGEEQSFEEVPMKA